MSQRQKVTTVLILFLLLGNFIFDLTIPHESDFFSLAECTLSADGLSAMATPSVSAVSSESPVHMDSPPYAQTDVSHFGHGSVTVHGIVLENIFPTHLSISPRTAPRQLSTQYQPEGLKHPPRPA
jgi:hypothetical protein